MPGDGGDDGKRRDAAHTLVARVRARAGALLKEFLAHLNKLVHVVLRSCLRDHDTGKKGTPQRECDVGNEDACLADDDDDGTD